MADPEDMDTLAEITEQFVHLVNQQMISFPVQTLQNLSPLFEERSLSIDNVKSATPPGFFPINSLADFIPKCYRVIQIYHLLFRK